MFLLFLALVPSGLTAICNSAGWSDNDRQGILNVHNNLRSKIARGVYNAGGSRKGPARDMIRMDYDCGLEASAQQRASFCPTESSGAGENIHWRWSNGGQSITGEGERAAKRWERSFDDHGWTSIGMQSGVDQATQMAWSRTTNVGCGVNHCQSGQIVVVCHYSPRGNIVGENVYSPGPTCSVCPGGTSCDRSTGLCSSVHGQALTNHVQGGQDQRISETGAVVWNNGEPTQSLQQPFDDFRKRFQKIFNSSFMLEWNHEIPEFQQQLEEHRQRFQHAFNSIFKQWEKDEGVDERSSSYNWDVNIPALQRWQKLRTRIQHTFDRWESCAGGRANGTEWRQSTFYFRCEDDKIVFVGCVTNDGTFIDNGQNKTIGGFDIQCKQHAEGSLSMRAVQKHNKTCRDSQGYIRGNGESWMENEHLLECRNNQLIVVGWKTREPESYSSTGGSGSSTILTTSTGTQVLNSICAERLNKGDDNCTSYERPAIMWHMDKETLTCLAFKYTGCGGNTNRFATKEQCQRTCLPMDFHTCPANSPPAKRADNTSHCNGNSTASSLTCPRGSVCKMGYGAGLCCDTKTAERVNANYEPTCSSGKRPYKSEQFGVRLIHLGKTCSHDFCPAGSSCHKGDYFAYCCQ